MNDADRTAFADGLVLLAEALDVEISAHRMEIYWKILQDYDWPAVDHALTTAAKRKWFKFPQPGELIELIEGSPDDQAERGWEALNVALRTIGTYTSIECEDQALAETIMRVFGGWIEAAHLPIEGVDRASKRREFLDTYRSVRRHGALRQDGYLAGRFEAENRERLGQITQGQLPAVRVIGLITHDGQVRREMREQPPELRVLSDAPVFVVPDYAPKALPEMEGE